MKSFAALIVATAALLLTAGPAHANGPGGYERHGARVVVIERPPLLVRHYADARPRHEYKHRHGWGPGKYQRGDRHGRYYRPSSRICLMR